MDDPRHPGQVPDDPAFGPVLGPVLDPVLDPALDPALDIDTDGDGVPDTGVTSDGVDLMLVTDLDGDRFADQVLRIGPDGAIREAGPPPPAGPGSGVVDGLLGGAAAGAGS
ncbi:hypothetical protein GCM10009609_12340 [Pseudonocardia aurantiaca]|uniref:Uncharacterized protein n=1 Tax=Pseudonocardia aurantiaca TaxID=75290 RepID=A0ABW4FEU6_9PSEU